MKPEIKDYNVKINDQIFFDPPINNEIRAYKNIPIIATDERDDYTRGLFLDYPYFKKKKYKMIAKDLRKQQVPYADTKQMQQIKLTGNPEYDGNTKMLFILEKLEKKLLGFSIGTVKVL